MARKVFIKDIPNQKALNDIFSINRANWMQRETTDTNKRYAFYYGRLICEAHWLTDLNEITVSIYGKEREESDVYILYGILLAEMARALELEDNGIKVRMEVDKFADRFELSIIFYKDED